MTRILTGLALLVAWMVWLSATQAWATPMRPDIRRMIEQAQQPQPQFALARAGWNGPEARRPAAVSTNPSLAQYNPAMAVRANRAALLAAAIPDPRALLALGLCILLLRWMRHSRSTQNRPQPIAAAFARPLAEEREAA